VALREGGITAPILVLSPLAPEALPRALGAALTLTIPDEAHAAQTSVQAQKMSISADIHLKLDTGMHRIGFPHDKISDILHAAAMPGLRVTGTFSHFTESDDLTSPFTDAQYARFMAALDKLLQSGFNPGLRHIANSAAILRRTYDLDMVRAGIAFYGLSALGENGLPALREAGFRPALSVKSHIACVQHVATNEGIGYSRTYVTENPATLAIIPAGYADGFGRLLSNRGHVLIRGQAAPIRGNVCMDQTMVDITHIPNAQLGDEVVLIGTQDDSEITAEQLAALQQTIPYEIITRLGKRLDRAIL